MVDNMSPLADHNGDVVASGAHPDRRPIHGVIGFPDSQMVPSGDDRMRIRQGIRIVLHSPEQVELGHRQLRVMVSMLQQMPNEYRLPLVSLDPPRARKRL